MVVAFLSVLDWLRLVVCDSLVEAVMPPVMLSAFSAPMERRHEIHP
jgi:hypothetical protein